MKPIHTMLLSCLLTLVFVLGWKHFLEPSFANVKIEQPIQEPSAEELIPEEIIPDPEWKKYKVRRGDVLGSIMPKFGLSTNEIHTSALHILDLAKLREGQIFQFQYQPEATSPDEIRMAIGEDETLIIKKTEEGWKAIKESIIYESKTGYRQFVIESSLWNAAINVGLRARDIVQIAEVLESDIDFNTELRKGDTAELLVEELWQNGKFVKLGASYILKFTNSDKEYTAIRYASSAENLGYYDENGISRESPFLRSPLAFSRVTSKFNPKRFHPILKTKRPHNGTDFGAKTGTPVRSVSDGVVTFAGTNGGHGKYVKIRHQSPYETSYSHLSKINVKKGQKIKKGDLVGKVGTTGRSTGPHLHYQVWKSKRFVDAMKVQFPKGKKLPKAELIQFKKESQGYLKLMNELKTAGSTTPSE